MEKIRRGEGWWWWKRSINAYGYMNRIIIISSMFLVSSSCKHISPIHRNINLFSFSSMCLLNVNLFEKKKEKSWLLIYVILE